MMVRRKPCHCSDKKDGKASSNWDKSEDLPELLVFKAFGKKSTESLTDSQTYKIPAALKLELVLKSALFYILMLFSLPLSGQISLATDTIQIEEVVIRKKTLPQRTSVYKVCRVDSAVRKLNLHSNLADLLTGNTSLFIRNYGPGGIATASLRGTGAGHTQLTWNDININNPMPGQFDLSLIPAGFADDISIYYGGGSMGITSGGFGGVINLETKPEWKRETRALINPALGSFRKFSGLVKIFTGNESFQSVTKAFFHSSENDFRYLDTFNSSGPVWENRKNSQILQKGLLQEFYVRGSLNEFSARFWYQVSDRNLPSPVVSQQQAGREKQHDESVRSTLNYRFLRSNYDLNITAAVLADKLNYMNNLTSTDSRNNNLTALLKTMVVINPDNRIRLKISLDNVFNSINSNNYDGLKNRNATSLSVSSVFEFTERVTSDFLIRETFLENKLLAPDFSSGLEIKIAQENDLKFKTTISRNSKIPALNDMHWVPGGNPDLINETAYTGEVSVSIAGRKDKPFRPDCELTLFRSYIRNMIQWKPGEFSYWTADNIGSVNTTGFESETGFTYSVKRFSAAVDIGYAYTRAFEIKSESGGGQDRPQQLTYVPFSQLNSGLQLHWKIIYSSLTTSYTGRRFITADNSQYLPGYLINDIVMGITIIQKNNSIDLNLGINNIFNVNYQIMAWYPLPGRSFHAGIIIKIRN